MINPDEKRLVVGDSIQCNMPQTRRGKSVLTLHSTTLLLFCMVCVSLMGSSCVPMTDACLNFDDGNCEWLARTRVDDPHFDFDPPLTRSRDFWLRAGDQMKGSWAQFAILATHRGATCDFSNPEINKTDPDNCKICTYCPWNYCGWVTLQGSSLPTLLAHEGQMPQPTPSPIFINILNGSGCSNHGFGFSPPRNASYELRPGDDLTETPIATTRVFVITPGAGQSVQYQLQPLVPLDVTDAVFYSGTVPGTPTLSDNFNTTLHISKVRILKGQPDADPLTGKLRLKDSIPVHPSRLVFIANYREDDLLYHQDNSHCYAKTGVEDGDLDLTKCRATPDAPDCTSASPPTCNQGATPTYLATDPKQLLVTWVAEFKRSEGGVVPTLAAGEVLAIEFTIEAN